MFNKINNTLLSNDGLRVTYIVIFVATILTIYELYMFFFVITPTISQQTDNSLDEVGINLKNDINKIIPNFNIDQNINNVIDEINLQLELLQQFNVPIEIINNIKNNINKNLKGTKKDIHEIKNLINSIFKTLNYREQLLIEKINTYTKITGIFMLLVLGIILYMIKYTLNKRNENIGICSWVLIITTTILIGIFQYIFYMYGQKYNYLGSKGKEELVHYLIQHL